MMSFDLNSDQRALRDEVVALARELSVDARQRDRNRQFDRELWRTSAACGLQGLPVPTEYGGRNLTSVDTVVALEALGYGCEDGGLVFALCAHLLAGVVPLWKHGDDQQRRRLLPGLCDGSLIAANAMTEPQAGSDVFSISMKAERDGAGHRLTGTKTLITNAAVADWAIVFAVTDSAKGFHGGLTAFLVDMSSHGVARPASLNTVGVRSCSVGEIQLNEVFVPDSMVLGGIGGGSAVFNTAMEWERGCLFAAHVGAMERLLEVVIRRARTRKQFGQTIGKFQAVAHRVADMKVQLDAARLLTWRSAWRLENGRTAALDASITKLFVSEAFLSVAIDAVRTFGGQGLLEEHDVERIMRDALASVIYSGTSDIQRNIIARWLGL